MLFPWQKLLDAHEREEALYTDYKPPALDAIHLPCSVLYLLMAALIVVVVAYAIVGHLIKDLAHDFADWVFGLKPEEQGHGREQEITMAMEGEQGCQASCTLPGMEAPLALPPITPRSSITATDSRWQKFF